MIQAIELPFTVKLLYLIVAVYFFLTIGTFLDLLDSFKADRKDKK